MKNIIKNWAFRRKFPVAPNKVKSNVRSTPIVLVAGILTDGGMVAGSKGEIPFTDLPAAGETFCDTGKTTPWLVTGVRVLLDGTLTRDECEDIKRSCEIVIASGSQTTRIPLSCCANILDASPAGQGPNGIFPLADCVPYTCNGSDSVTLRNCGGGTINVAANRVVFLEVYGLFARTTGQTVDSLADCGQGPAVGTDKDPCNTDCGTGRKQG